MSLGTSLRHQELKVDRVSYHPHSNYCLQDSNFFEEFFITSKANTCPAHLSKSWWLCVFDLNVYRRRVPLHSQSSSLEQIEVELLILHCHHYHGTTSKVQRTWQSNRVSLPEASELWHWNAKLALTGTGRALPRKSPTRGVPWRRNWKDGVGNGKESHLLLGCHGFRKKKQRNASNCRKDKP